jgi:hypothetical protein
MYMRDANVVRCGSLLVLGNATILPNDATISRVTPPDSLSRCSHYHTSMVACRWELLLHSFLWLRYSRTNSLWAEPLPTWQARQACSPWGDSLGPHGDTCSHGQAAVAQVAHSLGHWVRMYWQQRVSVAFLSQATFKVLP